MEISGLSWTAFRRGLDYQAQASPFPAFPFPQQRLQPVDVEVRAGDALGDARP
jgi:hypothetical protein